MPSVLFLGYALVQIPDVLFAIFDFGKYLLERKAFSSNNNKLNIA